MLQLANRPEGRGFFDPVKPGEELQTTTTKGDGLSDLRTSAFVRPIFSKKCLR
jgi:hypothetical protein